MTVPDPQNYWEQQNRRRQRVRTQRGGSGWDRSGSSSRTSSGSGNGRGAQNHRGQGRPPARGRDPGPPAGRGRLEGTTHAIPRRRRRSLVSRIRPRRRKFGKLKFGGPITMAWSGITLLLGAAAYVFQGVAWLAFAGASLGVTTVVGVVEARTHRSAAPRPPRKTPNKPAGGPSGTGGPKSGSGPKPSSGGSGARRCGDACKRSPKPKSTCRCKAANCEHGSLAGAPT